MSFKIEKFGVYFVDLPRQEVTVKGNGRISTVVGNETYGAHPCAVVATDEFGQYGVVVPMTSAKDARGGEKYRDIPKTWVRVQHKGHAAYLLTEQLRYACRERFINPLTPLDEYDKNQLESRVKFLFGIV
jgi:mRNA-degrading endonuclease toxin of MazEF toxin-antitoxin module